MTALRLRPLLCAAWALVLGCQPHESPVEGWVPRGGGSETTLVGRVLDEQGRAVEGAAVRMRHEEFNPLDPAWAGQGDEGPAAAFSDSDGQYRIEGVATGSRYLIECRGGEGIAAAVLADAEDRDSVRAPDAILRPTGAIRGRMKVPDSVRSGKNPMYITIPGLWQRIVADDDAPEFLFTDVPAGTYRLRLQPPFTTQLSRIGILEVGGIRVAPAETTDVGEQVLPLRNAGTGSAAYAHDSAVIASFNTIGGGPIPVEWLSGVLGNRVVMFYDLSGFLESVSDRIKELDAVEAIYLRSHFQSTDSGYPWRGPAKPLSPALSELPRLRRLWLPRMPAAGHPQWTGDFPALTNLNLAEAGMDSIPDWVLERKRLAYLDLAGNDLEAVPEALSKLRELRILNLSGNGLHELPPFLPRMASLRGVNLRGNRICSAGPSDRAWIARQDSLWLRQQDPLEAIPDGLSWEESQTCGTP